MFLLPQYRCLKHNEIMAEMLIKNKIKPYCLTCKIEVDLQQDLMKYKQNEDYHVVQHNKYSRRLYIEEVVYSSIKSFFITIIFFNFFTAFNFAEYSVYPSIFIALVILILKTKFFRVSGSLYSIPTMESVTKKVISENSSYQRDLDYFLKNKKREYDVKSIGMDIVDQMDGYEFEVYIGELLKKVGFTNVKVTRKSGDGGVDIIAVNSEREKTAIQCKRLKSKVSNSAVQEIYLGKKLHKCKKAMIIMNSFLTKPAFEAAYKTGIEVWSRNKLIEEMKKIEVKYSWEDYVKQFYELPNGNQKLS